MDIGNLPLQTSIYISDLMMSKVIMNHLELQSKQKNIVLYTLKKDGLNMCATLIKNNEATNSLTKVFEQEFGKKCSPPKSKYVVTTSFTTDLLSNESVVKDFNVAELKMAGMEVLEIQTMQKENTEKQKECGIVAFADSLYTTSITTLRKYFSVLE